MAETAMYRDAMELARVLIEPQLWGQNQKQYARTEPYRF
jgi:hypothetical protein